MLQRQQVVFVCTMQLFFESQQEQVTKLLGKEGDLVSALLHKSGTWNLPIAVSVPFLAITSANGLCHTGKFQACIPACAGSCTAELY